MQMDSYPNIDYRLTSVESLEAVVAAINTTKDCWIKLKNKHHLYTIQLVITFLGVKLSDSNLIHPIWYSKTVIGCWRRETIPN